MGSEAVRAVTGPRGAPGAVGRGGAGGAVRDALTEAGRDGPDGARAGLGGAGRKLGIGPRIGLGEAGLMVFAGGGAMEGAVVGDEGASGFDHGSPVSATTAVA